MEGDWLESERLAEVMDVEIKVKCGDRRSLDVSANYGQDSFDIDSNRTRMCVRDGYML